MTNHRLITVLLSAVALLAAAPAAAFAAAASDPQFAAQEPLRILRVADALDEVAQPLADVPVLVADTGLDLTHPDISPRLFSLPAATPAPTVEGLPNPAPTIPAGAHGWDLIGNAPPDTPFQPDADPSDVGGHGTAVAGILGAAWNNGQGGAGVAPNARFLALRTCWVDDDCYQNVQAAAVAWAIARGVRVVSFSWLADPADDDLVPVIKANPNVLFVTIPSGNGEAGADIDGENPYPCNVNAPNVLCVSTSSPTDGLDCGGSGATAVDVAVPTQNNVMTTNGGGFAPTGCATSFASPTAAGLATILFGIDPSASAADVRAAIVDSARSVPAWQGKSVSGGIADAAAAVALFQQRRGIAPRPPSGTDSSSTTTPPVTRPAATDRTAPNVRLAIVAGTRLRVTLSEPARVSIALQRRARCRGGRPCWKPVGPARTASLPRGATTLRLAPHGLPRGQFRVVIRARDAAGNAATKTLAFRGPR